MVAPKGFSAPVVSMLPPRFSSATCEGFGLQERNQAAVQGSCRRSCAASSDFRRGMPACRTVTLERCGVGLEGVIKPARSKIASVPIDPGQANSTVSHVTEIMFKTL